MNDKTICKSNSLLLSHSLTDASLCTVFHETCIKNLIVEKLPYTSQPPPLKIKLKLTFESELKKTIRVCHAKIGLFLMQRLIFHDSSVKAQNF